MSAINATKSGDTATRVNMTDIKVRIRPTTDGSHRKQEITIKVKQPSLAAVKAEIIVHLQPRWDIEGEVKLTAANIILLLICGNKIHPVVEENLEPCLEKQRSAKKQKEKTIFEALEFFTDRIPEDLYRTVKPSQLKDATFARKDAITPFTEVSPLFCAAFTESESKWPWFGVDSTGNLKVNGVSLFCRDEAEKPWPDDATSPFAEIGLNEETGVFSMSIEQAIDQYKDSVTGYHEANKDRGFLDSNVICKRGSGDYNYPKPDRISITNAVNKERDNLKMPAGEKKLAKQRCPFLRFKLKKGLDISGYGVGVVFDNVEARHYSLVMTDIPSDADWLPNQHTKLYAPQEHYSSSKEEVIREICKLSPGNKPESFMSSTHLLYIPKAAALYAFHDMKLVASAEPAPPQVISDDKDELHMIYEGALVLFHCDLSREIVLAIEALEKVNYAIKALDESSRNTLLQALTLRAWFAGLDDAEDVLKSHEEWDSNRTAIDALFYLQDALTRASTSAPTLRVPALGNYIKAASTPQGKSDKENHMLRLPLC